MKIGYPCINKQLTCKAGSTFRLKSYSEERLINTVQTNLECLQKILEFNKEKGLLFFRISSDTVPFASHPICQFNWKNYFSEPLRKMGEYIKNYDMRISMHPSQFVIINALNKTIVEQSIRELAYHCELLDAMQLDSTAKVQIHVGGVYDNKMAAIDRFVNNYHHLSAFIKKRLVIENDDKLFNLSDCLVIHKQTRIPIIFDNLHHECNPNGQDLEQAFAAVQETWQKKDGQMMVDYSSQAVDALRGKHTESLDDEHFIKYLKATQKYDFDIMLEIKNKDISALRALMLLQKYRKIR